MLARFDIVYRLLYLVDSLSSSTNSTGEQCLWSSTLQSASDQDLALGFRFCYIFQKHAENCRCCGLRSFVRTRQCALLLTLVPGGLQASERVPERQQCANLTGNPLRQLFWDQRLRQDPATTSSHPCREQLQGKLVCSRFDASKE